jgi:hypothetical protein
MPTLLAIRKGWAVAALSGVAAFVGACFVAGAAWSVRAEMALEWAGGWIQRSEEEPVLTVVPVEAAVAPARAAMEWFVPSLVGNSAFEREVAEAMVDRRARAMAARAKDTRSELAFLRRQLASRGLPDVWIGVPYVESKMNPDVVSPQCAAGYWQFLPEIAVSEGLRVSGCTLASARSRPVEEADEAVAWAEVEESPRTFSPGRKLPGRDSRVYLGSRGCRIQSCKVDERRDFERSTLAALRHLERISEVDGLVDHLDRVPLTLLGFNAGSGGAQRFLASIGGDRPFDVVPSCASGDCVALSREAATFVPRVVATAALVACNGADPAVPELSDWSRSGLCDALHRARLGPPVVSSQKALASAAVRHGRTWRVGLASLDVEAGASSVDNRKIDAWLLASLHRIPGIQVIPGVPGETAEELVEQGAEVVLTGSIGRRGEHTWVRLARWSSTEAPYEDVAFAFLDSEVLRSERSEELLADALLRPVRDRREGSVISIVRSRADQLVACFPPVVAGLDEPAVTLAVRLDTAARASLALEPSQNFAADGVRCMESALAALRFPRELAGASATLQLAVESPAVASEEDTESF